VHGANRLASNSLLEGLVFAARIGNVLASALPERREPLAPSHDTGLLPAVAREPLQAAMTEGAGVLRSAESLATTTGVLAALGRIPGEEPHTQAWEATNLHAVASVLAANATLREETRGSHWREDFPAPDDAHWHVRLVSSLDEAGQVVTRKEPVPLTVAMPAVEEVP
jgi:L-aspartate oxidase